MGLSVGAVGVGAGAVTGLMALSRHSAAEEACLDHKCVSGTPGDEDANAFHSLRTASTICYAVGALGVGVGVTLLLTAAPDAEGNRTANVSPYLGSGSAGLAGRF